MASLKASMIALGAIVLLSTFLKLYKLQAGHCDAFGVEFRQHLRGDYR